MGDDLYHQVYSRIMGEDESESEGRTTNNRDNRPSIARSNAQPLSNRAGTNINQSEWLRKIYSTKNNHKSPPHNFFFGASDRIHGQFSFTDIRVPGHVVNQSGDARVKKNFIKENIKKASMPKTRENRNGNAGVTIFKTCMIPKKDNGHSAPVEESNLFMKRKVRCF